MSDQAKPITSGGCLCGEVRYEVHGRVRDVVNCHCSKCRRFTGSIGSFTIAKRADLRLVKDQGLKWYRSVQDETPDVYRGFCSECGSSLFWDPRGKDYIAVTAGTLDQPTGLKTAGHVWLSQRGDYYELTDDLPRFQEHWES